MNKKMRVFLTIAAALVLVAASIGGTVAYLSATTDPVTNTFKTAKIEIELKEHKYVNGNLDMQNEVTTNEDYKLIPGATLPKNPFVRIKAGSEKCWVFVEVLATNTNNVVEYKLTDKWVKVDGAKAKTAGAVVYRYIEVVDASAAKVELQILANNQVTINKDMTEMPQGEVKLDFYAYAVQADHVAADDAWEVINPPTNP